jgi:predicted DNA binding CopG/RHH family protein
MKNSGRMSEKELIKSIERGEWRPSANQAHIKKEVELAARNTLLKDSRMNIRIARRDLHSLKAKALEQGMPYQTLVSSVLHKYVSGRLIEKTI